MKTINTSNPIKIGIITYCYGKKLDNNTISKVKLATSGEKLPTKDKNTNRANHLKQMLIYVNNYRNNNKKLIQQT